MKETNLKRIRLAARGRYSKNRNYRDILEVELDGKTLLLSETQICDRYLFRWEARHQARIEVRAYSLREWHAITRTFFATGEAKLRIVEPEVKSDQA